MDARHPQTQAAFEPRVAVASFDSPWEAELARSLLASEGLRAILADANLIRLDWFMAKAVGGVKVLVPESEQEYAKALLARTEEIQEIGLVTEEDQPGERHCPGCRSDNLTQQRWSRGGFVGSILLLGLPLPIPVRRWRCSRCKREWRAEQLG